MKSRALLITTVLLTATCAIADYFYQHSITTHSAHKQPIFRVPHVSIYIILWERLMPCLEHSENKQR